MTVLLEDEASGYLLRAARCDGPHAEIALATTRVLVHDHVLDCCDACLRAVTQIAQLAGVPKWVRARHRAPRLLFCLGARK